MRKTAFLRHVCGGDRGMVEEAVNARKVLRDGAFAARQSGKFFPLCEKVP